MKINKKLVFDALKKIIGDEKKWVTTHNNIPEGTGKHILIDTETGEIESGLGVGGQGKTFRDLKNETKWKTKKKEQLSKMHKHNLENEEYEELKDTFYNDDIPSFSEIEDPKGKYYKEYHEKEQKILSDFHKYIKNNNISPKDAIKEYKKQRIQQKLDTIKSRIQDRERNKNYHKGDMIDEIKKYGPNNENNKTHFIDKASFADLQEVIDKVNALNAEKFYNSNDKDKIKQNKILNKLQQELKDNQNNKDLKLSRRLRYALDDFLDPNRTKDSNLGDFELAKVFLDKVKKDRAERKTKILYAKNDKFNKKLNELQKQQKQLKGGDLEQSLNKEKDLINQNKRNINLTSRLNKNTLFPSANTKQLLEQVENKKKSLNKNNSEYTQIINEKGLAKNKKQYDAELENYLNSVMTPGERDALRKKTEQENAYKANNAEYVRNREQTEYQTRQHKELLSINNAIEQGHTILVAYGTSQQQTLQNNGAVEIPNTLGKYYYIPKDKKVKKTLEKYKDPYILEKVDNAKKADNLRKQGNIILDYTMDQDFKLYSHAQQKQLKEYLQSLGAKEQDGVLYYPKDLAKDINKKTNKKDSSKDIDVIKRFENRLIPNFE